MRKRGGTASPFSGSFSRLVSPLLFPTLFVAANKRDCVRDTIKDSLEILILHFAHPAGGVQPLGSSAGNGDGRLREAFTSIPRCFRPLLSS